MDKFKPFFPTLCPVKCSAPPSSPRNTRLKVSFYSSKLLFYAMFR